MPRALTNEKEIERRGKISYNLKEQYKSGNRKAWNSGLNKNNSEKIKQISEKLKGFQHGHKWKKGERISPGTEFKSGWQHTDKGKEILQKSKQNQRIGITMPEKIVQGIIQELKLPFEYTGNGKILIGTKNPDFINESWKQIIEVYGDYWHEDPKYWHQTAEGCILYYMKYGYDTLIIWQNELENKDIVKRRIEEFAERLIISNPSISSRGVFLKLTEEFGNDKARLLDYLLNYNIQIESLIAQIIEIKTEISALKNKPELKKEIKLLSGKVLKR